MKVIARKIIQEGTMETVLKLYDELVTLSRLEEGCISYELYQDKSNPLLLAVFEEWESKESLDKHKKSEHFTRIIPLLAELTAERLDFTMYEKLI